MDTAETRQLPKARQTVFDQVLSELENGNLPWWNSGITLEMPCNFITQKTYRGINLLSLYITAMKRKTSDPRWATFNQISDAGFKVRKGAKGVPIEIYKQIDKRFGKEADYDSIRDEVKEMTYAEQVAFKRENIQTLVRAYYVFNGADIEGLEPYVPHILSDQEKSKRNERIEKIIAESDSPVFYDGAGRNYYNHLTDEIHLTDRALFETLEDYYSTALHELGHSTGHASRLNRVFGTHGDQDYAREELTAELSSVFMSVELDLPPTEYGMKNAAAYIKSWAKIVKDDPQTIIDAAFNANRAADYISNPDRHKEKITKKNLGDQSDAMKSVSAQALLEHVDKKLAPLKDDVAEKSERYQETYTQLKKRQQEEINAFPMASAFNKEQFTEGMQKLGLEPDEKDKIVGIGAGGFMRVDDVQIFVDLTARHMKELNNAIANAKTGETFAYEMFLLELANHEYGYTRELGDTLSALNLTLDGIESSPTLKKALERAVKTIVQSDDSQSLEKSLPHEKRPMHISGQDTKSDPIPEAMRSQRRWCAFKAIPLAEGKTDKRIIDCNFNAPNEREFKYLKWAKSNTPSTWADYETAKQYAADHHLNGVAFAMNGSGITCIDLDHQIDDAGTISMFAQLVVSSAGDTYAEKSVSGHGIHIFYSGSAPTGCYTNNGTGLEVFDTGHFICVTGDILPEAMSEVKPATEQLISMLQTNLGTRPVYYPRPKTDQLDFSDNEVIEKVHKSKKGGEFDRMWAGQITRATPSHTDMALCNMLAFFTGGDEAQVERIFRSSGLYREGKEKYLQHTIHKACASICNTYDPNYGKRSEKPSHRAKTGNKGASK